MSEHAYKKITRDIKEDRIGSVVLLYGKEQYLVNWAENLLVSTYVNPDTMQMDYTVFDAASSELYEITNACETIAMLSEKRVVAVNFGLKSRLKAEDILNEISDLPSETLLILTFEKENLEKEVFDAAKGKATLYDFTSLDNSLFRSFIGKRLRTAGKTISNAALKEFVEISGYFQKGSDYTLYSLENDLKKIIAHCSGDEISREEISELTDGNIEKDIFKLVDAISRNRKDEAYRMLHNLLSAGEEISKILYMIVSQLEIILSVKELREKSMTASQIHNATRIHEYRIKKAIPVADRYSIKKLKHILINAYEIDNNYKSGLIDGRLAIELFIAEI